MSKRIKMNKELKALNELCKLANASDIKFQYELNTFTRQAKVDELKPIIETTLKQSQKDKEELEELYEAELKNTAYYNNIALKYKKVLDIIKKKSVDIGFLQYSSNLEIYNTYITIHAWTKHTKKLTKEEYSLLREILL